MPIDFVTPTQWLGPPTGPTKVISRSELGLTSNDALFVGIVGDSNNSVRTVSADVANAVTIEDAGVAGAGIHWFRLSHPHGDKVANRGKRVAIQAKDAKGTVVTGFSLAIIDLPKGPGLHLVIDPADPKHPNRINLRVYAPKDDADYVDIRMTGVGYNVYYGNGFQVRCARLDTPIEVPEFLVNLNPIKAEPIDDRVYDTLAQANEAIRQGPAKAKGVTPFAYYRGAGGAVIAPTIFSAATTPRIIATMWGARRLYVDYVERELRGVAIGIAAGVILRPLLGRFLRAVPEDPQPRALTPPIPNRRISPPEITEETVRAAMKGAPLKSQQARVSLPTIRKYAQMLREGKVPPAIKVDQGIIVEGNHRYIAGRICGKDPPIQPWAGGRPAQVVPWEKILIDAAEW
jgi:hypothetical protein